MNRPLLVDSFGRPHNYLRISVTDRCNLRCGYCMPPEGVTWVPRSRILTFEEIARIVGLMARMGVNRVRLTGGEPLLRRHLDQLVGMIAGIDRIHSVGMTTNGVRLAEAVAGLRRAGLTHLNISLDTLHRDRFRNLTLGDELPRVLEGIDAALAHGFVPLKLNVVVMRGINDDELTDFVDLTRERPIAVRFIEFMPFDGNRWSIERVLSYADMKRIIERQYHLHPRQPLTASDVSKDFSIDGHAGGIGFITSMTDAFCDGCNRLRLTAEGAIKPCLHDIYEVGLREALRRGVGDADLVRLIHGALSHKRRAHPPAEQLVRAGNRVMIQIGG